MERKIKRPFVLFLSLPIMSTIIGAVLINVIVDYRVTINVSIVIIFLGLISIIATSIVTYCISMKLLVTENKYLFIEKQLDCQIEHYKKLEKKRARLFEAVHDFKNHLHCMYYLYKKNKCKELNEYMEKLLEISTTGAIIDTRNPVIDALLSEKISLALKKGIDIKWDLCLPVDIKIEYIDFCAILGNSLDNAIEACERITDNKRNKSIMLSMNCKNSYIVMTLANSYNKKASNRRKKSAKAGLTPQIHGFGLKSIERAVKKYNGNVLVRKDKNLYHLTIVMLIA